MSTQRKEIMNVFAEQVRRHYLLDKNEFYRKPGRVTGFDLYTWRICWFLLSSCNYRFTHEEIGKLFKRNHASIGKGIVRLIEESFDDKRVLVDIKAIQDKLGHAHFAQLKTDELHSTIAQFLIKSFKEKFDIETNRTQVKHLTHELIFHVLSNPFMNEHITD